MTLFNADDFARLRTLFDGSYAGYKPNVIEAPNGDGKLDVQKRYLHVATKYDPPEWAREYLQRAYQRACHHAALDLHVPHPFWPDLDACALRVLEYPPGADSAEHTDFDLFTFNAYRNTQDVVGDDGTGLFIGEIGEMIGLGKATPHSVPARPYEQHSIVFFALPSHDAVLPTGQTVGEWLKERMARSRYDR
jgi:hypothetical protein